MAINEKIVTGRKFRRLIDKESRLWQRISYWTKACDVEFDDGKTAETKIASINDDLRQIPKFIIDEESGKITGYTTEAGADTVFPFSSNKSNVIDAKFVTSGTNLLEIWPDLFDYNIETYIVCDNVTGKATACPGGAANETVSVNPIISVSIDSNTGIITFKKGSGLIDSGHVRIEVSPKVQGAVVILSKA